MVFFIWHFDMLRKSSNPFIDEKEYSGIQII